MTAAAARDIERRRGPREGETAPVASLLARVPIGARWLGDYVGRSRMLWRARHSRPEIFRVIAAAIRADIPGNLILDADNLSTEQIADAASRIVEVGVRSGDWRNYVRPLDHAQERRLTELEGEIRHQEKTEPAATCHPQLYPARRRHRLTPGLELGR
jgi:hypothetical protein